MRTREQEIAHLESIGVLPAAAVRLVEKWIPAGPQPLVFGWDPEDYRPLLTWGWT